MFAKCGYIEEAKEIFDKMFVKETKAWNSMMEKNEVIKWFCFVHL